MADKAPQSFANHAKIVPGYHYWIALVVLINLVWSVVALFRHGLTFDRINALLLALGLVGIFYYVRIFPLRAQDRVIRLEEELRMARILPEDLRDRMDELTRSQRIALRFASDEELPDLTREILDQKMTRQKDIKQRIRTWRGDYWRL